MGARLILLRHGQIRANKSGRWHGSTDSPLTWRGRTQARRTGRHLAATETIDAVYTSPLQRCRTTATLATRHLDLAHTPMEGLQEMAIGEWEDLPFKVLAAEHQLTTRMTEDPDFCAPGGESLNQVAHRMGHALREIDSQHDEGQTVLVVSHGVALAIATAVFLQNKPSAWTDYRFHNCSLSELFISPQPVMLGYNETHHL